VTARRASLGSSVGKLVGLRHRGCTLEVGPPLCRKDVRTSYNVQQTSRKIHHTTVKVYGACVT
jgi:hypothetical protein